MAHISIYVSSQVTGRGGVRVGGTALVSPGDDSSVPWPWQTIDIPWTATAAQVNQAILDAALAAVSAGGYTTLPGDNRIVIGGAVGVM